MVLKAIQIMDKSFCPLEAAAKPDVTFNTWGEFVCKCLFVWILLPEYSLVTTTED